MKKGQLGSEGLLLLSAVIWGFSFVAQRVGMRHVGPFTFNAVRFALGSIALIPFATFWRKERSAGTDLQGWKRAALLGGAVAGTVIFIGVSFQQIGIQYTTAGKSGFITGLYVVLVPVLGLAIGRKTSAWTWAGVLLAAVGLYLLSFTGSMTISKGDLIVLAGTLFWAVHVLLISVLIHRTGAVLLAIFQFSACSVLSFAAAFLFEEVKMAGILGAAVPILYGGLMSVGVAYTLQVVAQRRTPPAHAAIILSLETVFAALGGWIFLGEIIPARGLAGCALMLAGIILSQAGTLIARGNVYRGRS
ncbi:MAG TPA: DMT family transporter, partial [Candidatus Eisenbacteria bacterium]|nr:DMT family transporter [Candidatus Eisenbacteria bacterium]